MVVVVVLLFKHQNCHGTVCSGARKGEKRSFVAGEYPVAFCHAFAQLLLSYLKRPKGFPTLF